MATNEERIAVVEIQIVNTGERIAVVEVKLDSLLKTVLRYKGFIGGVLFTLTALGTAIGTLISYFLHR